MGIEDEDDKRKKKGPPPHIPRGQVPHGQVPTGRVPRGQVPTGQIEIAAPPGAENVVRCKCGMAMNWDPAIMKWYCQQCACYRD